MFKDSVSSSETVEGMYRLTYCDEDTRFFHKRNFTNTSYENRTDRLILSKYCTR